MPTQENIQLVSRKQVSERWQKSIETLKRWEKARVLTALKIGRDVRYRLAQIEGIEAQAEVR